MSTIAKDIAPVNKTHDIKYELSPPDGGWGYVITISVALIFTVTIVPMVAFGLIFGQFLASIGDETTGTAITNGMFNTVFSFTGLMANHLFTKYSYKFVAIVGSIIFSIGNFSIIYASNLFELVISFGVIQGIGMGLLMPAILSVFNNYFDKKLGVMNAISQTIMIMACILAPGICQYLMDNFGFKGTVALLAAVSLNSLAGSLTLQPVEWHMKKKIVHIYLPVTDEKDEKQLIHDVEVLGDQQKSLLHNTGGEHHHHHHHHHQKFIMPKPRTSIISMGDRTMSVTTINRLDRSDADKDSLSFWQSLIKSLNLELFKDPIYCNISFGLALSFTSDVAFISIMPLLLFNTGFDSSQTTLLITLYFVADLVARVLFSIISAFVNIPNRSVFLGGVIVSIIFRTAFVMRDDFVWKLTNSVILGFTRCFIQTPLPLVINDKYADKFATAISLYMVVCGVVSLVLGNVMSLVKSVTHSDAMVVHVLSLAYLICSITWIIEIVYTKYASSLKKNNNNVLSK